jgi:hypothetical protein
VWAALLAAERSGFLSGVAAIAAPHLRGVPVRAHAPELLEALRLPKRVTPPSWKQQLHSLRIQLERAVERENHSNHNGRELIYAIDLAETQRSGYPLIEVHARERRADGAWGKIKFKKFNAKDVSQIDDAVDRRVIATLLGATENFGHGCAPRRAVRYDAAMGDCPAAHVLDQPLHAEGIAHRETSRRSNGMTAHRGSFA